MGPDLGIFGGLDSMPSTNREALCGHHLGVVPEWQMLGRCSHGHGLSGRTWVRRGACRAGGSMWVVGEGRVRGRGLHLRGPRAV